MVIVDRSRGCDRVKKKYNNPLIRQNRSCTELKKSVSKTAEFYQSEMCTEREHTIHTHTHTVHIGLLC